MEAIASYEPDLVVYATEPGDLGASLEGLGIPALQQDAAASLDDVYAQIDQLGMATGNASEATELVEGMRGDIDSIIDSIEPTEPPLSFYHELDDTYYSVTSSTFIGQLYALTGSVNIADEAKGAGGGYPQLSAEYIIQANPDLIFLADTKCCGQSSATVAERPGWGRIAAVERGDVISMDDDIASRWGPRVVDFLRRIAAAVEGVPGGERGVSRRARWLAFGVGLLAPLDRGRTARGAGAHRRRRCAPVAGVVRQPAARHVRAAGRDPREPATARA